MHPRSRKPRRRSVRRRESALPSPDLRCEVHIMHAEVRTPQSTSSPETRIRGLAELLDLAPGELARLYEEARVPSLDAIRGDLRGRMLAWSVLPERANKVLMRLARSDRFPWRGKSFTPHGGG